MRPYGRASSTGVSPTTDARSALFEARARYAARNPASEAAHAQACRSLPGGNTRTVLHIDPFPLCFVRGEGATLTDLDDHRYDDFLCEYTAAIFGHSDPELLATLHDTSRDGLNLGGRNRCESAFAALLLDRFPALDLVRFTNSGTEANLLALIAARVTTGRDAILVFSGAYHGGVLSFGRPGRGNAPFDVLIATYNDLDGTRALLRRHSAEIAAVLVEPMLQSGGCIVGNPDFLAMLREETLACGALLIFDEVVTSRLHPGGMHAKLGLTPDLLTLGKYIGGGMNCGAFGGREDIMKRFDPQLPNAIPHAGTFNNNVLTMAMGHVGLSRILTAEAVIALNARGEALRERLNTLPAEAQVPMQFTGMGSIMSVHMRAGRISSAQDADAGDKILRELFYFHLLAQDVHVAWRGMINLSLATTEAQIDRLIDAVTDVLKTYRPLLRR